MQISKREFLKRLGLGGAGLVGGALRKEGALPARARLPIACQSAQISRGVSWLKRRNPAGTRPGWDKTRREANAV